MRRRLQLLILGSLSLAAATQAARLPRYGGGLRVEIVSPGVPDPLHQWGDDGALVGALFFEGLLRWGSGQVQPSLAKRWLHNDDFTRWIFQLHQEARFHDGARCDAQAVSESLHRLANPHLSRHTWILRDLVGWEDFASGATQQIEGIALHSASEIELHLQRPVPDLPARLALPAAAISRRAGGAVLGTGPFRHAGMHRDSLRALPFDGCRDGRPFLDWLDLVPGGPRTLQRRSLTRVDPLSPTPAGMTRLRVPGRRLALCIVNPASRSFRDAGTRQGLASSFDASVFVRAGLGGDGEPARSIWPRAAAITPATGSDATATGTRRGAVRLLVDASDPTLRKLGERMQLHLTHRGFEVTLNATSPAATRGALGAGRFDLVLLGWTPLQGEDLRESTRVLHLLSHLLQPALGSRMPPAWRDMVAGRAAASEESLRQETWLFPLVFFHDIWQVPDTVYGLQPGLGSPRLDLQDAHRHPSIP